MSGWRCADYHGRHRIADTSGMYQSPQHLTPHTLIRILPEGVAWVAESVEPVNLERRRLAWEIPPGLPAHEALHLAQDAFRGALVCVTSARDALRAG